MIQKKNQVAIGIGSNLGDKLFHIQSAIAHLEELFGPLKISSIVESSAQLLENSPSEWQLPFFNCAVLFETDLPPYPLLAQLKKIEKKIGRKKAPRWAPRIIDLDILIYKDLFLQEELLTIPHKELLNRPFALHPLAQLMPYWKYPVPGTAAHNKNLIALLHEHLPKFDRYLLAKPYFVGVVNITPDSYSDGGLFLDPENAVLQSEKLWKEGASFVELGAASTKPDNILISEKQEWGRLEPVLLQLRKLHPSMRIGINTYHNGIGRRALEEFDIAMINFMGFEIDPHLVKKIVEKKKKLVITHALTIPPTASAILPYEENPLSTILSWGVEKIAALEKMGLRGEHLQECLIIDPGISFGKARLQSLLILQGIRALKEWHVPLMVGHSRKGFMRLFSGKVPIERDAETAMLSAHLVNAGVEYLRVHNIGLHMELLTAAHTLSNLAIA